MSRRSLVVRYATLLAAASGSVLAVQAVFARLGANVDVNVEGSSDAVLRNWEEIKAAERALQGERSQKADSRLDTV